MPDPSQTPISFHRRLYLATNPDVAADSGYGTEEGAVKRFVRHGLSEGRSPNVFFDPYYYLKLYPDLQAAFGPENFTAALKHWIQHGMGEGRRGSALFDVRFYISYYPDLAANLGPSNWLAGFDHWMRHGIVEGRVTTPEIVDPLFEPDQNSMLVRASSFQSLNATSSLGRLGRLIWDNREKIASAIDWVIRADFIRDVVRDIEGVFGENPDDFESQLDRSIRQARARDIYETTRISNDYEKMERRSRTA